MIPLEVARVQISTENGELVSLKREIVTNVNSLLSKLDLSPQETPMIDPSIKANLQCAFSFLFPCFLPAASLHNVLSKLAR